MKHQIKKIKSTIKPKTPTITSNNHRPNRGVQQHGLQFATGTRAGFGTSVGGRF